MGGEGGEGGGVRRYRGFSEFQISEVRELPCFSSPFESFLLIPDLSGWKTVWGRVGRGVRHKLARGKGGRAWPPSSPLPSFFYWPTLSQTVYVIGSKWSRTCVRFRGSGFRVQEWGLWDEGRRLRIECQGEDRLLSSWGLRVEDWGFKTGRWKWRVLWPDLNNNFINLGFGTALHGDPSSLPPKLYNVVQRFAPLTPPSPNRFSLCSLGGVSEPKTHPNRKRISWHTRKRISWFDAQALFGLDTCMTEVDGRNHLVCRPTKTSDLDVDPVGTFRKLSDVRGQAKHYFSLALSLGAVENCPVPPRFGTIPRFVCQKRPRSFENFASPPRQGRKHKRQNVVFCVGSFRPHGITNCLSKWLPPRLGKYFLNPETVKAEDWRARLGSGLLTRTLPCEILGVGRQLSSTTDTRCGHVSVIFRSTTWTHAKSTVRPRGWHQKRCQTDWAKETTFRRSGCSIMFQPQWVPSGGVSFVAATSGTGGSAARKSLPTTPLLLLHRKGKKSWMWCPKGLPSHNRRAHETHFSKCFLEKMFEISRHMCGSRLTHSEEDQNWADLQCNDSCKADRSQHTCEHGRTKRHCVDSCSMKQLVYVMCLDLVSIFDFCALFLEQEWLNTTPAACARCGGPVSEPILFVLLSLSLICAQILFPTRTFSAFRLSDNTCQIFHQSFLIC